MLHAAELSVAERMAPVMRDQLAEGGCSEGTLIEAGFDLADVQDTQIVTEARRLANRLFVREDQPVYDRQARIATAAMIVLGLMPSEAQAHAELRRAGFTNHELGDLWPEIIARAADTFADDRAPHQRSRS